MSPFRWHAMLALATLLAAVAAAQAQQNSPRIGYVYPAGGRQGTTFEVVVGGQFLTGTAYVHVSGAGVQATVIEYNRPLTQKEFMLLRDQLKELMDKKAAAGGRGGPGASTRPAWTPDDDKKIAEIRKKLTNPPNRQGNPAIAETVKLQIAIAANAEPGEREIRLGAPNGLTNPLLFCVGQLPEFSHKAAGATAPVRFARDPRSTAAEPDMSITLPAVVNGQIMPGATERFRFQAAKGTHLVVAARARGLIPYLPDAVPGWFQATLGLYDAKGTELEFADHYRFHPDPVLYYEVPQNGEYVVEIRDALYRGREDFVYRVALGELPYVTDIFPLGGPAGAAIPFNVKGWNLPLNRLTQDEKGKGPGIYPLSSRGEELVSSRTLFAVDTLPECLEQEPNDQPSTAQPVTLPIIVNGRIDRPGDWDVFRFDGRAGQEIVAEVYARRLNSPLDSVLKLTDAAGKQLAYNDDYEDKGSGLTTHQADSRLSVTLPAGGTYYLHLGDTQHKGGPEYAYRLRISPPQGDFALRVVPSSLSVRSGASVPVTVYALRKDGFAGEIALALKDAPAGFALSGARVPANQDQVRLTLTAPPTPPKDPIPLHLEGRATIQGRQVVRPAVPAEDMMQAFSYRHLVAEKEWMVEVTGRGWAGAGWRVLSGSPVRIPAGGTARLQVAIPVGRFVDQLQIELSDPPAGIAIRGVSPAGAGMEIVLTNDAAKARPGLKGNLILSAFAERTATPANGKAAVKRRILLGALPAVPFEVVAP